MLTSVVKHIPFCAGHRLVNHAEECAFIHGHNYRADIEVAPKDGWELDEVGRVVDFKYLKMVAKGWIDRYWDHALILKETDRLVGLLDEYLTEDGRPMKIYIMDENPTAENMARELMDKVSRLFAERFDDQVEVRSVTIWETDTSFAKVEL